MTAAEAALTAWHIAPADLVAAAAEKSRVPGQQRIQWVVEHTRTKVESPLESLARGVVVLAGLPEPTPQVWVRTREGNFRVDLLDEANKVIIEADGKVKYASGDDVRRESAGRTPSGTAVLKSSGSRSPTITGRTPGSPATAAPWTGLPATSLPLSRSHFAPPSHLLRRGPSHFAPLKQVVRGLRSPSAGDLGYLILISPAQRERSRSMIKVATSAGWVSGSQWEALSSSKRYGAVTWWAVWWAAVAPRNASWRPQM